MLVLDAKVIENATETSATQEVADRVKPVLQEVQ